MLFLNPAKERNQGRDLFHQRSLKLKFSQDQLLPFSAVRVSLSSSCCRRRSFVRMESSSLSLRLLISLRCSFIRSEPTEPQTQTALQLLKYFIDYYRFQTRRYCGCSFSNVRIYWTLMSSGHRWVASLVSEPQIVLSRRPREIIVGLGS